MRIIDVVFKIVLDFCIQIIFVLKNYRYCKTYTKFDFFKWNVWICIHLINQTFSVNNE